MSQEVYNWRKPKKAYDPNDLGREFQAIDRAIPTTVANLTDYVTGTFTPAVTFATPGDVAATYGASNAGQFTKIARLVTFAMDVDVSSLTFTTAAGDFRITGLPYTSVADPRFGAVLLFHGATLTYSAGVTWLSVGILPSDTKLYIGQHKSATSDANVTIANLTTGNALRLRISGSYLTTS